MMISETFLMNKPLGWDRMAYQHRGHGKYVDVVRLFGWDALEHYKTVVPNNLKECQAHAKLMYPKDGHPYSTGHDLERDHAWAYENWNESYAKKALDQIEMIQKLYFPDDRPPEDRILIKN